MRIYAGQADYLFKNLKHSIKNQGNIFVSFYDYL